MTDVGRQGRYELGLPPSPIFVLGLTQRTGTNFLWELLSQHPATTKREPLWEDGLLSHADQLVGYAWNVQHNWPAEAQAEENSLLLRYIGAGLVSFLNANSDGRRIITKTPSVVNLPLFFELFPNATLLLVVRDGRSVVESAVRSFGFTYAAATREWSMGAQAVLDFADTHPQGRYRVVHYEKLLTDLERELREILAFCDLSPDEYDFGVARELPLRGSSTDRGSARGVNWSPVRRPENFNGLRRWDTWSDRRHQQFNLAAGTLLARLGYEPTPVPSPGPVARGVYATSTALLWLTRYKPFSSVAWHLWRIRHACHHV